MMVWLAGKMNDMLEKLQRNIFNTAHSWDALSRGQVYTAEDVAKRRDDLLFRSREEQEVTNFLSSEIYFDSSQRDTVSSQSSTVQEMATARSNQQHVKHIQQEKLVLSSLNFMCPANSSTRPSPLSIPPE